jgi:nitrite reductase (NADH) small subunit
MDGNLKMTHWVDACDIEDIPVRGARRLRWNGGVVGIFRTADNSIHAIDNVCPHKQGPLSEGIVHDCAVTCPLHNFVIDLKTGIARGEDDGQVQVYPVEIRGTRVFVDVGV